MTCKCRSYNRPSPGQTDPETILAVPDWVTQERRTVCVDRCIAPLIEALWAARIWTHSCCCGHNGTVPRHVVVDAIDRIAAEAVIADAGADLPVFAWELIGPAGAVFPRATPDA